MGWDLRSGLDVAGGSYLVYLDGDGQVATHDALEVYRRLRETGADVVKGRREVREDGSVRTLTSLGYNLLFRILFRTAPLWDVNGQPKGLTRAAYERLDLRTDDWFTDAEIVLKARAAGLEIVEVPVRFRPRRTRELARRPRHGLGVPRQHGALAARPPPRAFGRRRPKSAPQGDRARPPLGAE